MNFPLKNKTIFVEADAPGGIYSNHQILAISEVAAEDSPFLKITEGQMIGFMIDESKLLEVQERLGAQGLLTRPYHGVGPVRIKSCVGELCPHAEADALADALEVSKAINETLGTQLPHTNIGINGCHHSCAHSATDDIHIVADAQKYQICIGGKSSDIAAFGEFLIDDISPQALPSYLANLLLHIAEQRLPNETIHDLVERVGIANLSSHDHDNQTDQVNTGMEKTHDDHGLTADLMDFESFEDTTPDLDVSAMQSQLRPDDDLLLNAESEQLETIALDDVETDSFLPPEQDVDVPPRQVSRDFGNHLIEEDLDVVEASDSDLLNVTAAMRAEAPSENYLAREQGEESHVETPLRDNVTTLNTSFSEKRHFASVPYPSSIATDNVKIAVASSHFTMTLQSGVDVTLDLHKLGGKNLELDCEGSRVQVSNSDSHVIIEHDSMTIRYPKAKTA